MISTSGKSFLYKYEFFLLTYKQRLLLTDPKSRKVIICESPLVPIVVKQTIARILFDYFQVPSLSFVPIHLMALMTTGLTTGLVIDCGHLETTTLPVSILYTSIIARSLTLIHHPV
jgi:actin-related protein